MIRVAISKILNVLDLRYNVSGYFPPRPDSRAWWCK